MSYEGRVAALLELGAGFNLEFTGIENVFMTASLMGFSRRETEELLPQIERFAEIGDFIHQPVKVYSSGMYVRLAFATAVSTDPQILIIDEALSVGDALFQHRCLRRIKQMQERGTTILFVSHDPSAVKALCSRAILLNNGQVDSAGTPADVLNRYQGLIMEREQAYDDGPPTTSDSEAASDTAGAIAFTLGQKSASLSYTYRHGDGSAEILAAELLNAARQTADLVETGDHLVARMRVRFHRAVEDPCFGFLIRNRHGIHAYGANTEQKGIQTGKVEAGEVIEISFAFESWLGTELYSVSAPVEGIANLNATVSARRLGKVGQTSQPEKAALTT